MLAGYYFEDLIFVELVDKCKESFTSKSVSKKRTLNTTGKKLKRLTEGSSFPLLARLYYSHYISFSFVCLKLTREILESIPCLHPQALCFIKKPL